MNNVIKFFLIILLLNIMFVCYIHAYSLEEAEKAINNKNYQKATYIYKKLSEKGNQRAQYMLARSYESGIGVSRNNEKAIFWYKESAIQGNIDSQLWLGHAYFFGNITNKNYDKSIKWFKAAVDKSKSIYAQAALGITYLRKAILKDDKGVCEKAEMYLLWAEQAEWPKRKSGLAFAKKPFDKTKVQESLGMLYHYGCGKVRKSHSIAVKWLKKASNNGSPYAQGLLAVKYLNGNGVPQNFVKSYKWANIAASRGVEQAKKMRNRLNKIMEPEQINKAQHLSSQFMNKRK